MTNTKELRTTLVAMAAAVTLIAMLLKARQTNADIDRALQATR